MTLDQKLLGGCAAVSAAEVTALDERPVDVGTTSGRPGSGDILGAFAGETSGSLAGSPVTGAPGADGADDPAGGSTLNNVRPGWTNWSFCWARRLTSAMELSC